MKPKLYWHIHHGILCEFSTGPIKNRTAYIKAVKPEHEIKTRLRLLKPVKGKLPEKLGQALAAYDQALAAYDQALAAYDQAWATCDQAWAACGQAWAACGQARAACDQALAACDQAWAARAPELEALHKKECPNCPWNGQTIFPGN